MTPTSLPGCQTEHYLYGDGIRERLKLQLQICHSHQLRSDQALLSHSSEVRYLPLDRAALGTKAMARQVLLET
jgi:hypothetical protein